MIDKFTAEDDPLPYRTGLDALGTLARALSLLSRPSSPSPPSPFSRLPAELNARVVHFGQSDDLRLQQNTNLALSRTCRALYLAVRPILAAELHLFKPGQLERRRNDGSWTGKLVCPLIEVLGERAQLDVFDMKLNLGPSPPAPDLVDDEMWSAFGCHPADCWVCLLDSLNTDLRFSRLQTLAIPFFAIDSLFLYHIVAPPAGIAPTLQHLELTIEFDEDDDLHDDLEQLEGAFQRLAPSLRHLVLRLHHLEVGGNAIHGSFYTALPRQLPLLRHLFILPSTDNLDEFILSNCISSFPEHLKVVTLALGCVSSRTSFGEMWIDDYTTSCKKKGIELRLEAREAEVASLRAENP
ncbi:hypothetical protein JCM8547_006565 [Rhodosporidiobolus lusitaniae]